MDLFQLISKIDNIPHHHLKTLIILKIKIIIFKYKIIKWMN